MQIIKRLITFVLCAIAFILLVFWAISFLWAIIWILSGIDADDQIEIVINKINSCKIIK